MEKELKIGDNVLLEQAWEDDAGYYHDEYLTIKRILPDRRLQFRIGHYKTRKQKDQLLQAWINKFEWYADDVKIIKDLK